jgi:hypothetical protein
MNNVLNEVRGKHISYRPELDGIRGLSIILIVFHHLDYVGYTFFGGRGFLAVDIFFVLSGFLITQILISNKEKGNSTKNFYLRRIARLYPMLLISVLGLSIYFRNNWQMLDRHPAIASILYYKNFTPWGGLFGPLWSLSAEEQFYLVFPIVLFVGLKYLHKHFLASAFFIYLAIVWQHGITVSGASHNFNQDGIYNLVIFRPSILLVGCLIALYKDELEALVSRLWWIFFAAFFALVAATIASQFPPLAGLATALLILLLAENSLQKHFLARAMKAVLGFRPLAIIGLLSYSIYLWHLPLIFISTKHFSIHAISNLWIFFGELILVGAFSFYVIEKPLMKLIVKLSK